MCHRARALWTAWLLIPAALTVGSARASDRPWQRWEVTLALRVTGTNGKPATLRLALPPESPTQKISDITTTPRRWKVDLEADGSGPHVTLSGKSRDARRFAVSFRVTSRAEHRAVGRVMPVDAPPPDLLPFLSPSPLFQSRSILVREFLDTHVAPSLASGQQDVLRAIFDATRSGIEWRRNGKSLPLDVIRRGQGKRIGIERAFVTFLRCAHIPARLVEGIDLHSTTQRKRRFWTEVWTKGRWVAVSASQGWIGHLPAGYVALTRDGERVLSVDGAAKGTYVVQARRLGDGQ